MSFCVYTRHHISYSSQSPSPFFSCIYSSKYPAMCSSIHQPVHSYFHHIHFPSTYSCSSTHTCIMYIFILMYMYMHMIQSNKSYLCFWYTAAGVFVPKCDGPSCIKPDNIKPKCSHLSCLFPGSRTLTAQRETSQHK